MKLRSGRFFSVGGGQQKQPSNLVKDGFSIFKTWNKWTVNSIALGAFFLGKVVIKV